LALSVATATCCGLMAPSLASPISDAIADCSDATFSADSSL
jgi:hypothetical protein